MPFTTVAFDADMRNAAVTMLRAFKEDSSYSGKPLSVYEGRPASLRPPHAFVDQIRERISLSGPLMRQRFADLDIVVVHGTFDSADTVAQRDAFVDAFADWILANPHAPGASTLLGDSIAISDEADFVPVWLRPADQISYFATRITVAGYVGG